MLATYFVDRDLMKELMRATCTTVKGAIVHNVKKRNDRLTMGARIVSIPSPLFRPKVGE